MKPQSAYFTVDLSQRPPAESKRGVLIRAFESAAKDAIEAAMRERDEATKEFDRLRQDRYDALNAKTTEGWSAAEWQLRTGKAERERDAPREDETCAEWLDRTREIRRTK